MLERLNHYLNRRIHAPFFLIFSLLVYGCAFFFFLSQAIPNINFAASPDGQVSNLFTEQISDNHSFVVSLPSDIPSGLAQYLVPRSTRFQSDLHAFSMSSFYGLPVFYSFAHILFSYYLIFTFTLLSILVLLYFIIHKLSHSKRNAFYLTLFFALQPVLIYYALRGFMHNLLFLFFMLLTYAMIILFKKTSHSYYIYLTGIVLGFAGGVRMNELVWLFPLVLIILFASHSLQIKNLFRFLAGFTAAALPFIFISKSISSSFVQYIEFNEQTLSSHSFFQTIKSLIFPFGFDFQNSFSFFWAYLQNEWLYYIPLILILALGSKNYFKNFSLRKIIFSLIFVFLLLYLILYYGSSSFGLTKNIVSVGDSFSRYWFPIMFIFLVPSIFSLNNLSKKVSKLLVILLLFAATFSFFYPMDQSFQDLTLENNLAKNRNVSMTKYLNQDSVLLAGRADKFFIHNNKIVAGTRMHTKRQAFVNELLQYRMSRDVYYYHVSADISSHFTKEALEAAGVEFTYVVQFWDGGNAWEYLYKLDWPNKENNVNE